MERILFTSIEINGALKLISSIKGPDMNQSKKYLEGSIESIYQYYDGNREMYLSEKLSCDYK